ncbi:MAG: hypothetical protein ACRDSH_06090 [Pseudonocardiaceae bacterium]
MTTRARGTNGELERIWARTGWSRKELARRVNRRGQSRGLRLNTDGSRIRAWFAGQQPQPPVPAILCELFSEHFGYPVQPREIGLHCEPDSDVGLVYQSSLRATVALVADLGRNDVHRRDFLRAAPFVAVAAVAPSRDWLLATLDAAQRRPGGRIGHKQVAAIREAFAVYQEADVMRGGGHARRALAQYVTGHVLPLIREINPDTETGASLFAAASEQTYLLGWMAFDDGRQALAQRYLVQSLRLAEASGDAKLGSHVLAGMSDQARMLGHPKEALHLATAGRHGLSRAYSPACAADLWALQARAHGALGESREAAHAVAESEAAFERIERDNEPEWARFIDPAYLAGEWANAFGDIARPIESTRFARRSAAEARNQKRARRGALSQAALARAALTSGHIDLDAAVLNANRALDLAVTVKSSRCTAAISDLRSRIQPFHTVSAARDFDERARLALAASHQT